MLRQIKRLDVMDRHDCWSSVTGWQAPTEVMGEIGSRRVARQQHRLGGNPVYPSVHRARDPGRRVRRQRLMRFEKPVVSDDAELDLVGGMRDHRSQQPDAVLLGTPDLAGKHE